MAVTDRATMITPAWGGPWLRGPWSGLIAVPIAFVQVIGTHFAQDNQPDKRAVDWIAIVLLLLGPAALTVRWRHPVPVLAGVLGVTVTYLALDYPYGPVFLSLAVAYFTAVASGHLRAAVVLGVIGWACINWVDWVFDRGPAPTWGEALAGAAWVVFLTVAGAFARTRWERQREVARARESELARLATEERLRIARELHDVLAHNISLINVQAGVALHLMDDNPEQVRDALTAIKAASKETLTEMRSVLGALRAVDEEAPRTPTSGLSVLPELTERMAAVGVDVTMTTSGAERPLPGAVDLAAFRIAQEALTNVHRHAGAVSATVSVDYGDDELTIRVGNERPRVAPPPAEPGSGHGIAGMRERAAALGGTLRAGPRADGGFVVIASLPIEEHE